MVAAACGGIGGRDRQQGEQENDFCTAEVGKVRRMGGPAWRNCMYATCCGNCMCMYAKRVGQYLTYVYVCAAQPPPPASSISWSLLSPTVHAPICPRLTVSDSHSELIASLRWADWGHEMHPTTEPYYNNFGTRTCGKGKAVRCDDTHTARGGYIALAGSASPLLSHSTFLYCKTKSHVPRECLPTLEMVWEEQVTVEQ